MTADNYSPATSKSLYLPGGSRQTAGLWAREKVLHDLADFGAVEFFEGAGDNPTGLSGYSKTKLWLRADPGVTTTVGSVRYFAGGTESLLASWPVLTKAGYAAHFGVRGADMDYVWTTTTAGDPGTGKIGLNHATPASATQLRVSKTGRGGQAYSTRWTGMESGRITVYGVGVDAAFGEVTLTGSPTDAGAYYTFPIVNGTLSAFVDGMLTGVAASYRGDAGSSELAIYDTTGTAVTDSPLPVVKAAAIMGQDPYPRFYQRVVSDPGAVDKFQSANGVWFEGTPLPPAGLVFDSIASLRAMSSATTVSNCVVLSYHAGLRRGGGRYWYDATDTGSADNGGTVIVSANGWRWKLLTETGLPTLEQFGAKNDGATLDDAALDRAIATGLPFAAIAGGGYAFASSHVFTAIEDLQIYGFGAKFLITTSAAYPLLRAVNCPGFKVYGVHFHSTHSMNFVTTATGAVKIECRSTATKHVDDCGLYDCTFENFRCAEIVRAIVGEDSIGVAGHTASYGIRGLKIIRPTIITHPGNLPLPGVGGISAGATHVSLSSVFLGLFGDTWQQYSATPNYDGWILDTLIQDVRIVNGYIKSVGWIGGGTKFTTIDGILAGVMHTDLVGINTGTGAYGLMAYNNRYLNVDPNGTKIITTLAGIAGPLDIEPAGQASVVLSGIFVATCSIQGWNGTAWVDITTGITTTGIKSFAASGYTQARVICTAYTSGTITVGWNYQGDTIFYAPRNVVVRNGYAEAVQSCFVYFAGAIDCVFQDITCLEQREAYSGLPYAVIGGSGSNIIVERIRGRKFAGGVSIGSAIGDGGSGIILRDLDLESDTPSAFGLKLIGAAHATAWGGFIGDGGIRVKLTGAASNAVVTNTNESVSVKIGCISLRGLDLHAAGRCITATDSGGGNTWASSIEICDTRLSGPNTNSMISLGAFGNPLILRDWIVDCKDLTGAAYGVLLTNAVNVTVDGMVIRNKIAGTGNAFYGVGAKGRLRNVQFDNCTAARLPATGLGVVAPTVAGSDGDVVENLNPSNTGAAGALVTWRWICQAGTWRAHQEALG